MNCLLKQLEISFLEILGELPKVIGWLGGGEDFLPERFLRMDQNLRGLVDGVAEERVSCHFWRA